MRFGGPEILLVLVIALVLFGPSRIPEIGSALGRSIREFRAGIQGQSSDSRDDGQPTHKSS